MYRNRYLGGRWVSFHWETACAKPNELKVKELGYLREKQSKKITKLFTNDVRGKSNVGSGVLLLPAPFTVLAFARGLC